MIESHRTSLSYFYVSSTFINEIKVPNIFGIPERNTLGGRFASTCTSVHSTLNVS
eukprot:m.1639277 g.1639277  ORF g.1639277 m.1639277 type:complete len:55 (+) comp34201_c0_seq1:37-201(+)